jgi:ferredoxin-NADP reductase
MTRPDPLDYGWWLASRAAGIVALLCITVSVGVGLMMASRMSPRLSARLVAVHQQTALVGLIAIAVHGITLLGDKFLDPGLLGISVPFVIDHAPLWTGLGVTGGWLAAILGLSYYARNRIGPQRWRRLHKATLLVYLLSVAHTLGSGTDASEPWMRMLLVVTGAPILFLFLVRILPAPERATGLTKYRVTGVVPESANVSSFSLEPKPDFKPGQFLTLNVDGERRSYSLSGPGRISVKREPHGKVSTHLHTRVEPGDVMEASGPHGGFVLDEAGTNPVVLVSAGIGATPVLAMLARLVETRSEREVRWIHGARNGSEHAFRDEARRLIAQLPNGHSHVRYSRPEPRDVQGRDYDAEGRVARDGVEIPGGADVYVCGPAGLAEQFPGAKSECFTPAVPVGTAAAGGVAVVFARSEKQVDWDDRFANLLELAEEHRIPAASGCRVGACHECHTSVVQGGTTHDVDGGALICCARPTGDVVLDL